MSTTEQNTTAKSNVVKTKRTYEGYNENLELVSKEVEVSYETVETSEKALTELNRINDYVSAANFLIKREALQKARADAGISSGISKEVVNEFVKPYRQFPQFAEMVGNESDLRKIPADKWNAQTKAILDSLKQVPMFLENIKKVSASRIAAETEE